MKLDIKIAFRLVAKHATTKLIGVLILSTGMLFFIAASTVYVKDTTFNKKFKNSANIFRVDTKITFGSGEAQELSVSPALVGPRLKEELSGVINQSRVWNRSAFPVVVEEEKYNGEDIVMVDHPFFKMFNFKSTHGNVLEFASESSSTAVLSLQASQRMFGLVDPIGRIITIDDTDYLIAAVVEESETDLDHSVYIPIKDDVYGFEWSESFIHLANDDDLASITNQINIAMEIPMEGQYNSDIMKVSFHPISLSEMRFSDKLFGSIKSNRSFLYLLLALSILLVVLCCLSVLNLESTISLQRIKEVTIKKIFGASVFNLFFQFFLESSLVLFISLPLSFIAFFYFVPIINSQWGYNINLSDAFGIMTIEIILLFTLLYILLMSIINYWLHVQDGEDSSQKIKNPRLIGVKRFLLPFQLFICSLIVLFTSLATNQVENVKKAKIGFNYEDVWVVDVFGEVHPGIIHALKEKIKSLSYVTKISMVYRQSIPGRDGDIQLYNLNFSESSRELTAKQLFVDEHYFDLLNIENKNNELPIEEGDISINVTMAKNHKIDIENENTLNGQTVKHQVDGYFHDGVFSTVKPTVFENDDSRFDALLIKAGSEISITEIVKSVNEIIKGNNLPISVEIESLEDIYFSKQKNDRDLIEIIRLCDYFIIAITFFGIISSTNMVYNLTLKQNIVRRILGATSMEILLVSAKRVYKEVFVAILIALITAHLLYLQWQNRYIVKIPFELSNYFAFACLIAVSFGTFISFFYFKVSTLKPTERLK